ncbi:putative CSL zinc finger [Lyophyllum shimeji]|uniref:Diphthamide biosynthesis protein 4 n=1 Tax=Lyophyllum shimeji TaxID=47721 RepID=A0A9P3UMI4_LYOSH|nr:putative CSL zinc finger [Lyophyllum shimeji]
MAWKPSFTQGISCFKASRLDEALSHFTLALKHPGGDQQHVIYDSRAAVYEKLEMQKEALRDAKMVIKLAQDQWQGYARSARLFFLARRYDAALKMANMALERVKPTNTTRRAEILRLKNQILEARRAEEQRTKAAQNQIEKLPVELLGEIFRMVISSDVAELIGILRVCRYWRNVAWHAPLLWETLILTPKSPARKLSLWLKQSNGRIRELDIRAGVASNVDWPFQELKDIPWDKLRVCKTVAWDVAGFLEKQELVPHGLSSLETLEMAEERFSQRRASSALFPLLQTAGIRSLSFVRSTFSWTELSAHLTTLTTLRVENSGSYPGDFLRTLAANPGLETLIIQDASYYRPADATPVCLPHLKHLEFWGSWAARLLEFITAPALEVLNIKGSQDALDTALSTLTAADSFTSLRQLAISSSPVSAAVIIRLLKHAPALTHLDLIYVSKGPNAVIEALAGPALVPSSPGKRHPPELAASARPDTEHVLCPALTHINLSASADVRTGPLVRLVRARLPLAPATSTTDDTSPRAAGQSDSEPAMVVDEPEPAPPRCARILGLTLDGCEQIEADWLPWFKQHVPAEVPSFVMHGIRDLNLATSEEQLDFYQLLAVPKDASASEIKTAYHRALLRFHPDKNRDSPHTSSESICISLIKEAYNTLSEPSRRKLYDSATRQRSAGTGPRPAQIVSLDEFEEVADNVREDEGVWQYQCRCGGKYRITGLDMEKGHHLVGCNSCSEVVWVGYELQCSDSEEG